MLRASKAHPKKTKTASTELHRRIDATASIFQTVQDLRSVKNILADASNQEGSNQGRRNKKREADQALSALEVGLKDIEQQAKRSCHVAGASHLYAVRRLAKENRLKAATEPRSSNYSYDMERVNAL